MAFRKPGVDVNARNNEDDAPIHSITKTKCPRKSKWKREVLYALLSKSPALVNLRARGGMTALHFAAMVSVVVVDVDSLLWAMSMDVLLSPPGL